MRKKTRLASKLFLLGVLAAFLFGVSAAAHSVTLPATDSGQQSAQAKTATGKVSSIAQDKKSLVLEAAEENGASNSMTFLIDENTKVTGRVSVGSEATVEYQPKDDGKLLALTISPKSGSSE